MKLKNKQVYVHDLEMCQ